MNNKKPAALKTDNDGNCVAICRTGQLEYIHGLITEEGYTQQAATVSFIEAVQAHVNDGDPITSTLTVEKVRSQFRRDSGKLKEKPKISLVGSTKEELDDKILEMAAKIQNDRNMLREFDSTLASQADQYVNLAEDFLNSQDHTPTACRQCRTKPDDCEIRNGILEILKHEESQACPLQ